MSGRATFVDMMAFGLGTLVRRPVHAIILIGVASAAVLGYYLWIQTPSGQAWFTDYMMASTGLADGRAGAYFAAVGPVLLISFAVTAIYYCGIYRLMLRENPKAWLPFQIGADEIRFVGLALLIALVLLVIMVICALITGALGFVAAILLVPNSGNGAGMIGSLAAAIVWAGLGLLMAFPIAYFAGRFAVSLPLSIKQRRFAFPAWPASKGAGLPLLFAHLMVFIALVVVQLFLAGDALLVGMEMTADPQTGLTGDQIARLANPYGDLVYVAAPLQVLLAFLLLGPTAAVAAKAGDRQADGVGSGGGFSA